MTQKAYELARMLDSVRINPRDTFEDMKQLVADAKKYDYWLVYGLSCYNEYLIQELKGTKTLVGGAVGCASSAGEESTEEKVFAAKHWVEIGCHELDMFMNVPMLRSGMHDKVLEEVQKIREMAPGILKVIIQSPMLNPEEIKIASEICVQAKADFVKTASGFYGPTTVEQVKIIKETVGDRAQIKAAGGVNGIEMIEELKALGVTRFGLSNPKSVAILDELNK